MPATMANFLVGLAVLVSLVHVSSIAKIPPKTFSKNFYVISDFKGTANKMYVDALKRGAIVTTFSSAEQQAYVETNLERKDDEKRYWIGFSDAHKERYWAWNSEPAFYESGLYLGQKNHYIAEDALDMDCPYKHGATNLDCHSHWTVRNGRRNDCSEGAYLGTYTVNNDGEAKQYCAELGCSSFSYNAAENIAYFCDFDEHAKNEHRNRGSIQDSAWKYYDSANGMDSDSSQRAVAAWPGAVAYIHMMKKHDKSDYDETKFVHTYTQERQILDTAMEYVGCFSDVSVADDIAWQGQGYDLAQMARTCGGVEMRFIVGYTTLTPQHTGCMLLPAWVYHRSSREGVGQNTCKGNRVGSITTDKTLRECLRQCGTNAFATFSSERKCACYSSCDYNKAPTTDIYYDVYKFKPKCGNTTDSDDGYCIVAGDLLNDNQCPDGHGRHNTGACWNPGSFRGEANCNSLTSAGCEWKSGRVQYNQCSNDATNTATHAMYQYLGDTNHHYTNWHVPAEPNDYGFGGTAFREDCACIGWSAGDDISEWNDLPCGYSYQLRAIYEYRDTTLLGTISFVSKTQAYRSFGGSGSFDERTVSHRYRLFVPQHYHGYDLSVTVVGDGTSMDDERTISISCAMNYIPGTLYDKERNEPHMRVKIQGAKGEKTVQLVFPRVKAIHIAKDGTMEDQLYWCSVEVHTATGTMSQLTLSLEAEMTLPTWAPAYTQRYYTTEFQAAKNPGYPLTFGDRVYRQFQIDLGNVESLSYISSFVLGFTFPDNVQNLVLRSRSGVDYRFGSDVTEVGYQEQSHKSSEYIKLLPGSTCKDSTGAYGPLTSQAECLKAIKLLGLPESGDIATHKYTLFHDGHCDGGFIRNTATKDTIELCWAECDANTDCGYFAYESSSGKCVLYTLAGGCPDDDQFPGFNAYQMETVTVWPKGCSWRSATPSRYWLTDGSVVGVGSPGVSPICKNIVSKQISTVIDVRSARGRGFDFDAPFYMLLEARDEPKKCKDFVETGGVLNPRGNYKETAGIDTKEACAELCEANEFCEALEYDTVKKTCGQKTTGPANSGEATSGSGDNTGVPGAQWRELSQQYCSGNWNGDWEARTIKDIDSCKASCSLLPSCTSITVGTWGGVANNCVLCTSNVFTAAHWTTSYSTGSGDNTGVPVITRSGEISLRIDITKRTNVISAICTRKPVIDDKLKLSFRAFSRHWDNLWYGGGPGIMHREMQFSSSNFNTMYTATIRSHVRAEPGFKMIITVYAKDTVDPTPIDELTISSCSDLGGSQPRFPDDLTNVEGCQVHIKAVTQLPVSFDVDYPYGTMTRFIYHCNAKSETQRTRTIYSVTPPVITSTTADPAPTTGFGLLTITGKYFHQLQLVTVADQDCTDPVVADNGKQLTCTLPAGSGVGNSVKIRAEHTKNIPDPKFTDVTPLHATITSNTFAYDGPTITDVYTSSIGSGGDREFLPTKGNSAPGSLILTGENFVLDKTKAWLVQGDGELFVLVDSTGECPTGRKLSETRCKELNGENIDGVVIDFAETGTWENPETCGCYLDQNGKVNFNRRTADCTRGEAGEKSICFDDPEKVELELSEVSPSLLESPIPSDSGKGAYWRVKVIADGQTEFSSFHIGYKRPSVATINPQSILVDGSRVTITGEDFGMVVEKITVSIDGVDCGSLVLETQHTKISCVPGPAKTFGSAPLVVAVDNREARVLSYVEFSSPPKEEIRFEKADGTEIEKKERVTTGYELTITGKNFGTEDTGLQVTIPNMGDFDLPIHSWENTKIETTIPPGQQAANIWFKKLPGTKLTATYAAPIILDISSAGGTKDFKTDGTSLVTMTGYNFGLLEDKLRYKVFVDNVLIDLSQNDWTSTDNEEISLGDLGAVKCPSGTYPVQTESACRHTTDDWEVVDNANMPSGCFKDGSFKWNLNENGASATHKSVCTTAGHIKFVLPAGSGTVGIAVQIPNIGQKSVDVYNLDYNGPSVDRLEGDFSTGGNTYITIHGENFGSYESSDRESVTVGGQPCTTASGRWTTNKIECMLPPGQGDAPIQVKAGGQTSATFDKKYDAPSVTSVEALPGFSTRGGKLKVFGSNFGGHPSPPTFELQKDNQQLGCVLENTYQDYIVCQVSQPGQGTDWDVVAKQGNNGDSSVKSAGSKFKYDKPRIDTVTAITDFSTKGSVVTVACNTPPCNFGTDSGCMVKFNGNDIACNTNSHDTLEFTTTPGTGEKNPISIIISGQASAVKNIFNYDPPVITAVSCAGDNTERVNIVDKTSGEDISVEGAKNCPTAGGKITITGMNFGPSSGSAINTVSVDGDDCNAVTITDTDPSKLECTLPERPQGGFDLAVRVTIDGQKSTNSPLAYSYKVPEIVDITTNPEPLTTSAAGTKITLSGTDFGAGKPRKITFGPTTDPTLYECEQGNVTNCPACTVLCELSTRVGGKGLVFELTTADNNKSPPSTETLDFPDPSMIAFNGCSGGCGDEFLGKKDSGQLLRFRAEHVGLIKENIKVTFVGPQAPLSPSAPLDCLVTGVKINPNNAKSSIVTCLTPIGQPKGIYDVQLSVLGARSGITGKTFKYPSFPIVHSVTGCGCMKTGPPREPDCNDASTTLGTDISVEECSSLCEQSATCKLAIWGDIDGVCKSYVDSCTNSANAPAFGEEGFTHIAKDCVGSNKISSYEEVGFGKCTNTDGDLPTYIKNESTDVSLEECKQTCDEADECIGVTYSANNNRCLLHGDFSGTTGYTLCVGDCSIATTTTASTTTVSTTTATTTTASTTTATTTTASAPTTTTTASATSTTASTAATTTTASATSTTTVAGGRRLLSGNEGISGASGTEDQVCYRQDTEEHTSGCPTKGQTILTIKGEFELPTDISTSKQKFLNAIKIAVGLVPCVEIEPVGFSEVQAPQDYSKTNVITCKLGAGVGKKLPVFVTANNRRSAGNKHVSYESPLIDNVYKTYDALYPRLNELAIDMGRLDNERITITGSNFGETSGVILVAGQACTNVQHDTNDPHSLLTCNLPNGQGPERPVFYIVASQLSNAGTVSYKPCPAGEYAVGLTCLPCANGTASETPGLDFCSPCKAGTFAGIGASKCEPCDPGTKSTAQASMCTVCQAGRVAPQKGSADCVRCDVGEQASDLAELKENRVNCNPCGPGTFAGEVGTPECEKCAKGKFGLAYGQEDCVQCGPGSWQNETGQESCKDCAVATAWTGFERKVECELCPKRTANNKKGESICSPCGPGTKGNETGLRTCHACAKGRAQSGTSAEDCVDCDPGKFVNTEAAKSCGNCQKGSHCPAYGMHEPLTCPPGTESETQAVDCTNCTAGSFSYSASLGCTKCEPGKFSAQEKSYNCKDCEKGEHQPDEGQPTCLQCTPGKSARAKGQKTCVPCAAGRSTEGKEVRDNCDPCAEGYETKGDTHQANCTKCDPGFFANSPGTPSCFKCEQGKVAPDPGTPDCVVCEAGTHQDEPGKLTCKNCTEGKYAQRGEPVCLQCKPGRYADVESLGECKECEVGKASDRNQAKKCDDCLEGKYQGAEGQLECIQCEVGKYRSDDMNATMCEACAAGKATDKPMSTKCERCEPGKAAKSPGFSECEACPPGTKSGDYEATKCDLCLTGRFSAPDVIGQNRAWTGVDDCTDCPEGFYIGAKGQIFCKPCNSGDYSDTPATVQCKECMKGHKSEVRETGTQLCDRCNKGRYAATTKSSRCSICDFGWYAPELNMSGCLPADKGHYVEIQQAVEQKSCTPGHHQSAIGQSHCDKCAPGTFQKKGGQATCDKCSPGYAQPLHGNTTCDICGVGKYAQSGQAECQKCDENSIARNEGSPFCPRCPKNAAANELRTFCRCKVGFAERVKDLGILTGSTTTAPFNFTGENMTTTTALPDELNRRRFLRRLMQASGSTTTTIAAALTSMLTSTSAAASTTAAPGTSATLLIEQNTTTPERAVDELYEQTECVECPVGADCTKPGTMWATMKALPGYWKGSDEGVADDNIFFRCKKYDHCKGGLCVDPEEDCPLGVCDDRLTSPNKEDNCCEDHRYGPMCAKLENNYIEDYLGQPTKCSSINTTIVYIVFVGLALLIVVILSFYIILRSGRDLVEADVLEQKVREATKQGYIVHDDHIYQMKKLRRVPHFSIYGAPAPKPNSTYKFKVLVSFMQILVSVGQLEIAWPRSLMNLFVIFEIFKLDLFKTAQVDCVRPEGFNYFTEVYVIATVPAAVMALCVILYVVPNYIMSARKENPVAERKSIRQKLWKLIYYSLWLLYPVVSAKIVRLYNCKDVQGTLYLFDDFNVLCTDEAWKQAALTNIVFVVLYPVGIPIFLFYSLFRYRNRLSETGVRASLGLLYDGYERELWWYEVVDILHKFLLTCIVVFFPQDYQMAIAMAISAVYLLTILINKPYIRKGDDRLALLAEIELICLFLAAHVTRFAEQWTNFTEDLIGVVLIFVVLMFLCVFISSTSNALKKSCVKSKTGKACLDKLGHQSWCYKIAEKIENDKHVDTEMFDGIEISMEVTLFKPTVASDDGLHLIRNPLSPEADRAPKNSALVVNPLLESMAAGDDEDDDNVRMKVIKNPMMATPPE